MNKINPIIKLSNVSKVFEQNSVLPLTILKNVTFTINEGEKVAIIGPSGSGKSTLLSLLAGLDSPTSGEILVAGKNISLLNDKEMSVFRNQDISIIFQSFELIAPFTVSENITAPLDIKKTAINKDTFETIIKTTKLEHRTQAFPATLSGGEKQRTAIARALMSDAKIILADEPTGSLDRVTGDAVLDLLLKEVSDRKKTLIIITHDIAIARKMDRILSVTDNSVYEETN